MPSQTQWDGIKDFMTTHIRVTRGRENKKYKEMCDVIYGQPPHTLVRFRLISYQNTPSSVSGSANEKPDKNEEPIISHKNGRICGYHVNDANDYQSVTTAKCVRRNSSN